MNLVGHTNNVYDVTESPVVNTAMAAQIGINTPSITEEHPSLTIDEPMHFQQLRFVRKLKT